MECVTAFSHSADLKGLREKGLAILGRESLLDPDEWAHRSHGLMNSKDYRRFEAECRDVGQMYGLAPWTIEWASLMKGYDPEEQLHVLEAESPQVTVVTDAAQGLFLQWLLYEAGQMGVLVHRRFGSESMPLVVAANPERPATELDESTRPPLTTAFRVVVEIPLGFPPEAARAISGRATNAQAELARRLGYSIPKRLRSSSTIAEASTLRVGEDTLSSGDVYDMVDELYGDQDLQDDQRLRNRAKNRRHLARKRLGLDESNSPGDQPPDSNAKRTDS